MGCSCGSLSSSACEPGDFAKNGKARQTLFLEVDTGARQPLPACGSAASSRRRVAEGKQSCSQPLNSASGWTLEQGDMLQRTLDSIFYEGAKDTPAGGMSFTIADPLQDGCPLVGCSSGFRSLSGYEMHEVLGRNCRFLTDKVPPELLDNDVRLRARAFCELAAQSLKEDFQAQPKELLCVQVNARKCGALFRNMFYLRAIHLGDRPYVVGLQAELQSLEDVPDVDVWQGCFDRLLANMAEVERVFEGPFWSEYNSLRWSPKDLRPDKASPRVDSLDKLYMEL